MSLAAAAPDANTIVTTGALVIIALIGGAWTIASWIAKRSRKEGLEEGMITRVTEAIDRLTKAVEGVRDDFKQHIRDDDRRFRRVDQTLIEHGEYLARIGERTGVESSVPHPRLVPDVESGPIGGHGG